MFGTIVCEKCKRVQKYCECSSGFQSVYRNILYSHNDHGFCVSDSVASYSELPEELRVMWVDGIISDSLPGGDNSITPGCACGGICRKERGVGQFKCTECGKRQMYAAQVGSGRVLIDTIYLGM